MVQITSPSSQELSKSPDPNWKRAPGRANLEISTEAPEDLNEKEVTPPVTKQASSLEVLLGTEKTAEQVSVPTKESFLDETIHGLKQMLKKNKIKSTTIPQIKDSVTVQVENIMSEGLSDVYRELPVIKQQEFKLKGEETAMAIRLLLRSTHVKIKKIFRLLLEWLKLLPGISQFFLVQEAKIKADKISTLKHLNN